VKSVSECGEEGQRERSSTYAVRRLPTGISVVRATGHLSGQTGSQMHQLVADELARCPTQLVLDLSDATSVDDAAVEAVLFASALAAESDTSFCLVAAHTGPVVRALVAADLIERFEIYATVGEAARNR
jgi:anti-anti-sigma regulatory factor